jgi:hypothetical protein
MADLEPTPRQWAFLFGVLGSSVTELVLLYQAYQRNSQKLPGRYRSRGFWIVRVLLALGSGGIAYAYFTPGLYNLVYVHVGAATPAIITQMSSPPGADER